MFEQDKIKDLKKSMGDDKKVNQWSHGALHVFGIFFVLITILAIRKLYPTWQSTTILMYAMLGITGVILCWRAISWHPANQASLVMAFISIIFSLYLGEMLLPVAANLLQPIGYKVSDTYDPRSRRQVVDDLRAKGIEAYTYDSALDIYKFRKTEWMVFPLGNIARKKMVVCKENSPFDVIKTDEYGFNNPIGLQSGKQPPSVVLLGDSFAEGECVSSGNDIGSFLRQDGVATVNLGRGGDGPLLEFATFLEYAVYLKPKAIFWLYYEGNDLSDLQIELTHKELVRYLNDERYSQQLREHQSLINEQLIAALETGMKTEKKVNSRAHRVFERLALVNLRGLLSKAIKRLSGEWRNTEHERYLQEDKLISGEFSTILSRVKERAVSWGGTFYFVYLPSTLRYASSIEEAAFHRQEVLRLVEKLGIPVIDFNQILQQHQENIGQYFPYYPKATQSHYTIQGYKLLSESILTQLKK